MYFNKEDGVLTFKGKKVFCHNEKAPFIDLLKIEYSYSGRRGSQKTVTRTKESIALAKPDVEFNNDKAIFKFSNDDKYLTLEFTPIENTLKITPIEYSEGYKAKFNFASDKGEKLFGLGERFLKLNLKGEVVENIVSEHIGLAQILAKAYPVLQKIGIKAKAEFKDIKTYCPIPVYTSDKMYSVWVDSADYGVFDFRAADANAVTFEQMPENIYFITGKDYIDLSKGINALLPSAQYLPHWVHNGMILGIKGDLTEAVERAIAAKHSGIAVAGIWCENWSGYKQTVAGRQVYWNWEYDRTLYPDLPGKIKELEKEGIRFLAYINPYLLKDAPMYNDFKSRGFLILNKKGKVYHIKTTTFKAGMIDLTNPEAFEYTKKIIRENFIDIGIKGWMADFGEYLPHDCVLYGKDARSMHNLWPVLWARCNREAIAESGKKDVFFFSRSGYSGIAGCSPVLWNGDQHTDYSPDVGMASVIPATLSLGISGVPLCHSDIAGFITFGRLVRDKGLWIRWLQMSAFSPLMRSHATPRPLDNVQFDSDKEVIAATALYSNIHKLLTPYLIHIIDNEAAMGMPAMRPVFYHYPNEEISYTDDFCYMLGNDLFVAPSFSEESQPRKLCVPDDNWICLFSGKNVKEAVFTQDRIAVLYNKASKFCDTFKAITDYIKQNGDGDEQKRG